MGTWIEINDENGRRVIAMDPVNEYIEAVDKGEIGEEMTLLKALDEEQLRFAITEMVGKYKISQSQLRHCYTKEGRKAIDDLRDLQRAGIKQTGKPIWADWPELNS